MHKTKITLKLYLTKRRKRTLEISTYRETLFRELPHFPLAMTLPRKLRGPGIIQEIK